jgi:Gametolysin peptidase M11
MKHIKAFTIAVLLWVIAIVSVGFNLVSVHSHGNSIASTVSQHQGGNNDADHRSLVQATTRTVVVFRLYSPTIGTPTVTNSELSKRIFTDTNSLTNHMARCSGGQQQLTPTTYGVVDVYLDGVAKGASRSEVVNAAKKAVLNHVSSRYTDFRQIANHIIFVVPDNGDGFVASAEIATQGQPAAGTYRDTMAASISVLMHEIGHNLGLNHATWNGAEYGDRTGNMGQSSSTAGFPLFCYNAANHWSLNWFTDSRLDLVAPAKPVTVKIPAFVDYVETASKKDMFVLVRLGTLYMQYNCAKDHNIGTKAMANQLVIVRQTGTMGTSLIAGLDLANPTYSDSAVSVRVCSVQSNNGVDYMVVSIGYTGTNCNAGTVGTTTPKPPINWWAPRPAPRPIAAPLPAPPAPAGVKPKGWWSRYGG